jgi:hypothetical protein
MKSARLSIAVAIALGSSPALAENWVTLSAEDDEFDFSVDKDSIHRGSDGLVYYKSMGFDVADSAADCQNRLLYTIKIYAHGGLDYPNWRKDGRAVGAGTNGEAELQYVCANS